MSANILLIDDEPANLNVLSCILENCNFDIMTARDGQSGLTIAKLGQPDLILLDIKMPEMDGFEVCRCLKQDEDTRDIPVIFATILADLDDKIKGFELGAVDYITKPYEEMEVRMRVERHLELYQLRQALAEKNAELEVFTRTVSHNLKNPLHIIANSAKHLGQVCQQDKPTVIQQDLDNIDQHTQTATSIIDTLLLMSHVTQSQAKTFEVFDMGCVMLNVEKRMTTVLLEANADFHVSETWPLVLGDPAWIEEVWINYISNALKYGGSPPRIELGVDEYEEKVRFWVQDNGMGLSVKQQQQLFKPFQRLHTTQAGHGLGLSIVQRIVHKLGGEVSVESELGQGSLFAFTLPKFVEQVEEDSYDNRFEIAA